MEYERFLDTATEEAAVEACRDADAVITCIQPFPKSVIERLDDSVSGRSAGMTGKSVRVHSHGKSVTGRPSHPGIAAGWCPPCAPT